MHQQNRSAVTNPRAVAGRLASFGDVPVADFLNFLTAAASEGCTHLYHLGANDCAAHDPATTPNGVSHAR